MSINYTKDSKAIEFWEYRFNNVLRIKYRSGRTYDYQGVPPEIIGQMVKYDSFGSSVACFIRGKYQYEEVVS